MKKLIPFIFPFCFVGCIQESPPITEKDNNYMHVRKGHYACKEVSREESRRMKDPRTHVEITHKCVFILKEHKAYYEEEKKNEELLKKLL